MDKQRTYPATKTGSFNPVFPYFLLVLALTAMGLWRIATTDPEWATPRKKTEPSPSTAVSATDWQPASGPTIRPIDESKLPTPAPAPDSEMPQMAEPISKPVTSSTVVPKATPSTSSLKADSVDLYLANHVGRQIPFLHKGQSRPVTLVAFTDNTVTIKTKKTLTLNRNELSAEQLKLWK